MKDSIGGKKELQLTEGKKYSYEEIKKLAVDVMQNEENESMFYNSDVQLGNFKNEIYDSFTDEKGRDCDFWTFVKRIRSSNGQIRLYLYTKKKDVPEDTKSELKKLNPISTKSLLAALPPNINIFQKTDKNVSSKDSKENTDVFNTKGLGNSLFGIKSSTKEGLFKRKPTITFSIGANSKVMVIPDHPNTQISEKKMKTCPELENIDDNTDLQELQLSVAIISEENIIFSDILIGKGAFGTVKLAKWLNTDVAVKSIKLSTNTKYILRELKILDPIRHPNFIQLMSVAINLENIFLVMEYFESVTLRGYGS